MQFFCVAADTDIVFFLKGDRLRSSSGDGQYTNSFFRNGRRLIFKIRIRGKHRTQPVF